jgi:hypothetical protein
LTKELAGDPLKVNHLFKLLTLETDELPWTIIDLCSFSHVSRIASNSLWENWRIVAITGRSFSRTYNLINFRNKIQLCQDLS